MNSEESILEHQIKTGYFEDKEPAHLEGVARRAVDIGFKEISELQRKLLNPHLVQRCEGVQDPGGHHNNCTKALKGQDLVDAYKQGEPYGELLCEKCIDERDDYENQWHRFNKD